MKPEEIKERIDHKEIVFSTSRSSGPGGQNVNKVNTKVELRFNVTASKSLSDYEKDIIFLILKRRITISGDLLIISQSARSQLQNKIITEEMFYRLLAKALTPRRERKATKPTRTSKEDRIEAKKIRGKIKKLRKDRSINTE